MSIHIGIIGDSHVASLRQGWSLIQPHFPDIELIFFAVPRRGMEGLVVDDGRLRGDRPALVRSLAFTSGTAGDVLPSLYDRIVLVGMGFEPPMIEHRHSLAVRRELLRELYLESLSYLIVTRLRTLHDQPIHIIPAPVSALDPGSSAPEPPMSLISLDWMRCELESLFADLGLRFVLQAETTLGAGAWGTKYEFAVGAPRLDNRDIKIGQQFPEFEKRHMNAEFGALMLRLLFERMNLATAALV